MAALGPSRSRRRCACWTIASLSARRSSLAKAALTSSSKNFLRLAAVLLVLAEIEIAARGDAFEFLGAEGELEQDVHAGAGVVREFLLALPVIVEHVGAEADARVERRALLDPVAVPHLPAPVGLRRGKVRALAPGARRCRRWPRSLRRA